VLTFLKQNLTTTEMKIQLCGIVTWEMFALVNKPLPHPNPTKKQQQNKIIIITEKNR